MSKKREQAEQPEINSELAAQDNVPDSKPSDAKLNASDKAPEGESDPRYKDVPTGNAIFNNTQDAKDAAEPQDLSGVKTVTSEPNQEGKEQVADEVPIYSEVLELPTGDDVTRIARQIRDLSGRTLILKGGKVEAVEEGTFVFNQRMDFREAAGWLLSRSDGAVRNLPAGGGDYAEVGTLNGEAADPRQSFDVNGDEYSADRRLR